MARKNIYRLLATYLLIILQGVSFASSNIFELNATTIEGDGIPLKQFQGKVILVVNTASRCGFTPQYKSLEQLFNKYKEKGFVVLAFPSNDFRQELSSNEEIKDFCEAYQLSFPIFAEGKVKGFGKQDLFKYLTEDSDGKSKGEIRWNFEKFLVSRDGKLFQRFRSSLDPNHKQITQAIESLL
ncbi:MAG: glutathione peroxidase [Alphaproteobacteria bacterium]|jgi:glutathione peroxidase|tara:strand:+ start:55 stop:603 length:549 start_codon:yes stop_codon:yes gene_type:complete